MRRLLDPAAAERKRESTRKWASKNVAAITAKSRLRREAKRRRAPPWLTREQRAEMRAMYQRARDYTELSGTPYHVDHVIPLQGETVSGLHVPWNLRVVPGIDNVLKSNRWSAESCPQ